MRWTTWTLFLAAAALLVGVGAMVSRQSRVTPEEFFEAVEKRIADGRYDREQTLLNLDQVLERARAAGNADLESRVLLRRGRILMELGAFDRARTDLLAVAETRAGDPEVENDLVELETRAGDFAAAEARVRRGLELDPDSPEPWTRLGRLHRLAAEENEEAAVALLARVLAPDELEGARREMRRSIARDPSDLVRPAFAARLRELLRDADEEVLQQILRFADRACEESLQARDACARAIERGLAPEATATLLHILSRAGRTDLAADLAVSTLRFDALRTDPDVARALLASLEELRRFRFGSELARQWAQRKAPVDARFLEMLARIGLRAGRWELQFEAGGELRGVGSEDDVSSANFYQGHGLVQGQQWLPGRGMLRTFVVATSPEPVPGARAMAWRAIAKASRALNEPEAEREALQGAIELEPRFDGELHLRMANLLLVAPHGGYRLPDTRFATGMSLLPHRTADLLPRWHEIGKRELASIGIDPEVVRAGLKRGSVWTPASDASPYELYRLAEIHHAAGDGARARAHLERLLELVPGFVPALDLAIPVVRAQDDRPALLALVAARVAAAGRTDDTTAVLREIPPDELEPRELRKLMRADPEYFGRMAAARALARDGRPRSALALLATIEPGKFGDEARVLGARLHLDAGQPAEALALLEPLGRALTSVPDAMELAVRGAVWSGASVKARSLLALAAEDARLGRGRRMSLADVALRAGEIDAARQLLIAVDGVPKERGGDLCLDLGVAAALDGDTAGAKRALARSEAFDTRGGLERAALAIAVFDGRTEEWKSLADRAAPRSVGADPLYLAALAVLSGRTDAARAAIVGAQSPESAVPADPRWHVLARTLDAGGARTPKEAEPPKEAGTPQESGTPDNAGTPAPVAPAVDARLGAAAAREIDAFVDGFSPTGDRLAAAAWIALSASPEGFACAAALLRTRTARGDAPVWTTWLTAHQAERTGDRHGARTGIDALLALAPDFAPAWSVREALDPELRFDPVAYGLFRGERLTALRERAGTPIEIREDRARWHAARGDHAASLRAADATQGDVQRSGELAAIGGRALLALGRPREAVERLSRALSSTPPPHDVRGTIGDLIAAVDAAESSPEPLPREDAIRTLTNLAKGYADDPRLVLTLARIDLESDPRNPALGVQRAISRLESYRGRFRGRALDAEVGGAAAAWIDFVARLDPDRAVRLAEEELDLDPGSLATWTAAARAEEARGERETAVESLRLVARIADHGEVSREILRIRAYSDMDASEVVTSVAAINALEGRAEPDAALHILAARSYLNLGPRLAAQALESARAARAAPGATPAERRAGARIAAIALLSRGLDTELPEAAALLEEVRPETPSRLEDDFLRALRGLARAAAKP